MAEAVRVGCIGCGNMGSAILKGLAERSSYTLYGVNRTRERALPLAQQGVILVDTPEELVRRCDVIIVALKPYLVEAQVRQLQPLLTPEKVLISVAAGVTQRTLREASGGVCPVVRTMPNTPALVGAGVTAVCVDDPALDEARTAVVMQLFATLGMVLPLPEKEFAAFGALVGAGPAYVFYLMDAVVQAGVTLGFPREQAVRMVTALFAGSVRMAEQSPHSLAELRDQVCSPAGITIDAVNHLERTAVKGHIIDAILAADRKGH